MTMTDNLRNADLGDLAKLLEDQHARKHDMVVPAAKLSAEQGRLIVADSGEAILTDEGVTTADGVYVPTAICDEGIADKLGIPVGYVKRMRAERPDLYDANVNGWLHGTPGTSPTGDDGKVHFVPGSGHDQRSFLFRTFRGVEGPGVARALLSDTFGIIDNFDVLTAALAGIREAGTDVTIDGCDLTERRMQVRIMAPAIQALAPTLLAGYRSPFDNGVARAGEDMGAAEARWRAHSGYGRGEEPVVFAGFVLSNSETGGGAFTITPRLIIKVCKNGMTITKDALRKVHLGARMDEGVVRWSADTQRKSLDLVTAQTRDAVATFLDVDYMTRTIERLEAKAATPIADAAKAVESVGKQLRFSDNERTAMLDHFIRGGQPTAAGVLNAVTSVAQTVADADRAADLEGLGIQAMELAAAI